MSEEVIEKTVSARMTRRTIVSTGTKLAYAAPVMAASIKLGTRSAGAVSPGGVRDDDFCGHSTGDDGFGGTEGCKGACKGVCGGDASVDATNDPCEQICANFCKEAQGNVCECGDLCNPAHFSCSADGNSVTYTGTCGTFTGTRA